MNLIGQQVIIKRNKMVGTVVDVTKNTIVVDYPDLHNTSETNPKRYIYPDCIGKFIELVNSEDYAAFIGEEKKKKEDEELQRSIERKIKIENEMRSKAVSAKKTFSVVNTPVSRFSSVEEFCDFYEKQLLSEIISLKNNGGKKIKIYEGKFIQVIGSKYYYMFESDSELTFPVNTRIKILSSGEYDGIIEQCDELNIIISTQHDFGHSKETYIESLEFTVEQWRLLQTLKDRIFALKSGTTPIVDDLMTKGIGMITGGQMNVGQETAMEMSLKQPITFVWGPPGTGKTETLAKIALAHIEKGKRVLMLSYSNVSVDGAILRTFERSEDKRPGKFIRYGYPKDINVKNHEYLTSFSYACYSNKDLTNEVDVIKGELKSKKKNTPEYTKLQERLNKIHTQTIEFEKKSIHLACFVATTVSKAIVDSEIYTQKFDIVIFDEASMAYVPQVVYAAGLAKSHFVCMGDFRQLPPIVQGKYSDELNTDIFQYCGITEAVESKKNHKWLCMLDIQCRMHKDISNFAGLVMYNGKLKTDEEKEAERNEASNKIGIIKSAFGIADLSGMMTTCFKTIDESRINILSAFISFGIAMNARYNSTDLNLEDIGIITPYTSQARLLHNMASDQKEKTKSDKNMSCATVHQFQGSEKELIIYDAVDCYRMTYPGMLITSQKNRYADRLFNVALTRTKSKFIAVANEKYLSEHGIGDKLMFGKLLSASDREKRIDFRKLAELNTPSDSCISFYNRETVINAFLQDIRNAKASIYIDIPDRLENNEKFLRQIINIIVEKKHKIKVSIRAEKKQNLPNEIKTYAVEHKFVMNPVVVVDKSIVWFGMPFSNAQFVSGGAKLNTICYPLIRFAGRKTARSIFSFLEMSKTSDESKEIPDDVNNIYDYCLKNLKCKFCGSPMQLKKSSKGKFFLACTGYPACNETRRIEVDDVNVFMLK